MSKIEDEVMKKIYQRSLIGKEKYGVTMEREDLSLREWLIHAQEECMDQAVYLEKAIQDLESNMAKKEMEEFNELIENYNKMAIIAEEAVDNANQAVVNANKAVDIFKSMRIRCTISLGINVGFITYTILSYFLGE